MAGHRILTCPHLLQQPTLVGAASPLGVHQFNLSQATLPVLDLLEKTKHDVLRRQQRQHPYIFNLGGTNISTDFNYAAEHLLDTNCHDIATDNQNSPTFIPETYLPQVAIAVEPGLYEATRATLSAAAKAEFNLVPNQKPEIEGDLVERSLMTGLRKFYDGSTAKVVVIQGADLVNPTDTNVQEHDVLIIDQILKCITVLEAKKTLNKRTMMSAVKQLVRMKELVEIYFGMELSAEWRFNGRMFSSLLRSHFGLW